MNRYFVEFWRDTLYQTVIEAEDEQEVLRKIEEKDYRIDSLYPVQWKDEVWTIQVTNMGEVEE